MEQYIWQNKNWPQFYWNPQVVIFPLAELFKKQGYLEGLLKSLSTETQKNAALKCLTEEIINSYKLENINLEETYLKSIIAQKLNINNETLTQLKLPHNEAQQLETIVNVFFDIIKNCNKDLSKEQLITWNKQLSSILDAGEEESNKSKTTDFRTEDIPLAPPAKSIPQEIDNFLQWFNTKDNYLKLNSTLKSALTHIYFLTICPFEKNNTILATILSYRALYHQDYITNPDEDKKVLKINNLFSLSSQLVKENKDYNFYLQQSCSSSLDMTTWLSWYIRISQQAVNSTIKKVSSMEQNQSILRKIKDLPLNKRQENALLYMVNESDNKISSTEYATIGKCSQDTACRDLEKLVTLKILEKGDAGGRSTHYSIII